jgi:hypothetical protein
MLWISDDAPEIIYSVARLHAFPKEMFVNETAWHLAEYKR